MRGLQYVSHLFSEARLYPLLDVDFKFNVSFRRIQHRLALCVSAVFDLFYLIIVVVCSNKCSVV
jgi:hypothetical protein